MHAEDVPTCMDANRAAEAGRKILILEEDEYLASILHLLLYREGFAISAFADAQNAQSYITSHAPSRMIFISHRWLRNEEVRVMDTIVQQPAWRGTPIIMLLNYYDLDLIERAVSLGITDCLLQPFEPGQLLDMIQKHLQHKPAHNMH